jgi:hypothetical protein
MVAKALMTPRVFAGDVDSTTQQLDVFDFDLATRGARRRDRSRPALDVDREVAVVSPRLDAEIRLPVSNPTCPAFGGRNLDRLYLTSAQHRLTPEQLDEQPLAGAIFEIDAGVRGIAANRFAG